MKRNNDLMEYTAASLGLMVAVLLIIMVVQQVGSREHFAQAAPCVATK